MTVRDDHQPQSGPRQGHPRRRPRIWCPRPLRPILAGLLGVAVALMLVSCGSSGKGLIPVADAGPLQSDFEAVAEAAQTGEGNCAATKTAIAKTEQDFAALPTTIDPGLHSRLSKGISNLRRRALALCAQPLPQTSTTTSTPSTTTSTQTTPTQTTSTQTTPTQTTTTTTPPTATTPGGGTPAPGNEASPGTSPESGGGTGIGGESGAGTGGAGESGAAEVGGAVQEGGK